MNSVFAAFAQIALATGRQIATLQGMGSVRALGNRHQAVIFAPHPDDSEIGAAALAHVLSESGWVVWLVVMTDDPDREIAAIRHKEMVKAARIVGVPEDRVVFIGFLDGSLNAAGLPAPTSNHPRSHGPLKASGKKFKVLQKAMANHGIVPDLVVVNHPAERHTDHVATGHLVNNLYPSTPTLIYSVPNYLDPRLVEPSFFCEITPELAKVRRKAQSAHRSQVAAGRILFDSYDRWTQHFGADLGLGAVEPYETRNFTRDTWKLIGGINASSFERLWLEAIDVDDFTVVHGTSRHRPHMHTLDTLRLTFKARPELPNLTWTYEHEHDDGSAVLRSGNVIVIDGPAANRLTCRHVNQLPLRYITAFSEPDSSDHRVVDTATGSTWHPRTARTFDGRLSVITDYGVLTILDNPWKPGATLISVAGATAVGTTSILDLLLNPTPEVLDLAFAYGHGTSSVQAVIEISTDDEGQISTHFIARDTATRAHGGQAS
jgi:LmbE family N-acetylglucosaminyl deacetylase